MKVLFIGGNGNISWWCVKYLLDRGEHEVFVLNRRKTVASRRPVDLRATLLQCDFRDVSSMKHLLEVNSFDVVCDFICYNKEQAEDAVSLFNGRVGQYIVISTAAVYDRQKLRFPLQENLPLNSEYDYVKNKIDMEGVFLAAWKQYAFPVTIIRPCQIYDTLIPDSIGRADFTVAHRMLEGKPIILCGNGTTLWTLLHSSDFASAFTGVIGNIESIGQVYHIAGDELLNWNQITGLTALALGVDSVAVEYMPISFIQKWHPEIGMPVGGHRIWCDIYDTAKIRNLLPEWKCRMPFAYGIKKSIDWLMENPAHMRINAELDDAIEDLLEKYSPCSAQKVLMTKSYIVNGGGGNFM